MGLEEGVARRHRIDEAKVVAVGGERPHDIRRPIPVTEIAIAHERGFVTLDGLGDRTVHFEHERQPRAQSRLIFRNASRLESALEKHSCFGQGTQFEGFFARPLVVAQRPRAIARGPRVKGEGVGVTIGVRGRLEHAQDALVRAPRIEHHHTFVRNLAHQRVAKTKAHALARFLGKNVQIAPAAQHRQHVVDRAPHRERQELRFEIVAQDRRVRDDVAFVRAEHLEPACDRRADRNRQFHGLAGPRLRRRLQQLFREKRISFAAPHDVLAREIGNLRVPVERALDQFARLRCVERFDGDAFYRWLAREPRQCIEQRLARLDILGAIGRHDQQARALDVGSKVCEQLERRAVGPMKVLDREHRGALGGEVAEKISDACKDCGLVELRTGEAGEAASERGDQIAERTEGTFGAFDTFGAREITGARIARYRAHELAQEARFSNAGFASDEDDAAATSRKASTRFVKRAQFVASPEEHRARHGADDHVSESVLFRLLTAI